MRTSAERSPHAAKTELNHRPSADPSVRRLGQTRYVFVFAVEEALRSRGRLPGSVLTLISLRHPHQLLVLFCAGGVTTDGRLGLGFQHEKRWCRVHVLLSLRYPIPGSRGTDWSCSLCDSAQRRARASHYTIAIAILHTQGSQNTLPSCDMATLLYTPLQTVW